MGNILPPSDEKVETFEELLEYAGRRVRQSFAIDPWGGFGEPIFEVGSRFDINVVRAAILAVVAALVALIVTRGPVFFAAAGAAAVMIAWCVLVFGKNKRAIKRWRAGGVVVPGALLQANEDLYDPGKKNITGAGMTITFDEALRRDPAALCRLADRLHRYKGAPVESVPAGLEEIVASITDEKMRYTRWKVPAEFCGNEQTFMTDLDMERERMPRRAVDRQIWLCLAHPTRTERSVEILPLETWWRPDLDHLTKIGWREEENEGQEETAGAGSDGA